MSLTPTRPGPGSDTELAAEDRRVIQVFFDHPRRRMTADELAGIAHLRVQAVVPILRRLERCERVDARQLGADRDGKMLRGYQLTLRGVGDLVPAFRRRGWSVPPGIAALVPDDSAQPATRGPAGWPHLARLTTGQGWR